MSRVRGGQVFVEIGADPRRLFKSLQDLNKHIGKIGSQLSGLGTRMTAFGAALTAPLALATRQFATFDDAIRATAAVSGASGSALQSLNDKARELGATTSFTAVQVANLMTELGRAGFRPDEIENMTGAVLDLARATGTDATLASGIMAATLRQFALGATDAGRAADVLTYAANKTFNTVEGLGESLKYAGPVAKSLGMSLEDTVSILGALGNVGIQGSEAGTALRRLGVISAASGKELQDLFGVSNVDAAGNLKPLVQILDDINVATAEMSVADRTARMAKAFGLLGITSANVLSGSAKSVNELRAGMDDMAGVANKTARAMDAGLGGAMRIAMSAVEGTALAIGDALAPSIKRMVDGISNVATGITAFVKENQELVVSVAQGIAIFTAAGVSLYGLGSAVGVVTFALSPVLSMLTMAAGAAMSLAMAALPVGKSLLSIGAAAVASVPSIAAAVAAMASYVASLAAAGAASVVAGARFAAAFGSALAADISKLIPGVLAFASSVAAAAVSYATSLATMVATTVTSTATMAASWLATAVRPITIWATTTAVSIAGYVTSVAGAVTATVTSTATMAAAWITSLMPATTAFVASAVASLGGYVLSVLAALSTTLASTAAMAAAWLAPLAPIALIGAAIAGAAALAYSFGRQITTAFAGVGGMVGQAAGAIGSGFGQAVADAKVVLSDMATTATTTFAGIYDAFAAGDLSLAMEIAWAGVQAVVVRGTGAVMSYIDPWIAFLQNTFTYAGATIAGTWESMWSAITQGLNTAQAPILGVVDNIVNGVMAAFDAMVAAVKKSWNWVQSFIVKGYDLAEENRKVDSEMSARAQQRSASRPGVAGRMEQARTENARTAANAQARIDAGMANADQIAQGRLDENERRRQGRQGDADALENRVGELRQTAADRRAVSGQVGDLDQSLGSVTSMEELQKLAATFRELRDSGKLSSEQLGRLETSLDAASERVMEAGMAGSDSTRQAAEAGAAAAQAQTATSAAEVVGTFSGAALGQMGFGQGLAQKQLDVMTQIEKNTREPMAGLVAD